MRVRRGGHPDPSSQPRPPYKTDIFGDFKFDNLAGESGEYHIEIASKDGRSAERSVNLKKSLSIGTVWV